MQYFIWWFVLLPFVVPKLLAGALKHFFLSVAVIIQYIASYGFWLYYAYLLEFEGKNTMKEIYYCGLVVFVANIILIMWHIYVYSLTEKLNKENEKKVKEN